MELLTRDISCGKYPCPRPAGTVFTNALVCASWWRLTWQRALQTSYADRTPADEAEANVEVGGAMNYHNYLQ